MNLDKLTWQISLLAVLILLLAGCTTPATAPTLAPTALPSPSPTIEPGTEGLLVDEIATLRSLKRVDDYPLYTLQYQGAYTLRTASGQGFLKNELAGPAALDSERRLPAWGCSLFAALGDRDNPLYGRNFDWQYSPAVLVFTDPPDGYASVSMVDMAYLDFQDDQVEKLDELPLAERRNLLYAPYLPFDGMNEHGLVVGMAAVPPGNMRPDPAKETIGSLMAIRKILDQARTVDQAVNIMGSYNIDMGGGPPIHYLIAEASGRAALVEFSQGQMVVLPNRASWHLATNFLRASAGDSAEGLCWRYDRIEQRLSGSQGRLTAQEALDLLSGVAQGNTQWSVVYEMLSGQVTVTMNRQYQEAHTFQLEMAGK